MPEGYDLMPWVSVLRYRPILEGHILLFYGMGKEVVSCDTSALALVLKQRFFFFFLFRVDRAHI